MPVEQRANAEAAAQELQALLAIPDDGRRLDALTRAAWSKRAADTAVLRPLAEHASELARYRHDAVAGITARALLANADYRDADYERAQRSALEALREAHVDPSGNPEGWDMVLAPLPRRCLEALALACTALAIATFRLTDYPNAVLYANLELHLQRYLGDAIAAALALHGLGWGYDKVGLFQKALEHHIQSLTELEKLDPKRVGSPLNGIAATYLNLGHLDKAREYCERALEVVGNDTSLQRERSTALRTLGTVHMRFGEHALAEDFFRSSMKVSDDYGASLNRLSLGELFLDIGRYDDALEHFRACLETNGDGVRRRSRCQALLGVGEVHLARGLPQEALAVLKDALESAKAVSSPLELYRVHHAISRAHRAMGGFEKALEHFEAFHRYREQLLREASDVRTQVLRLQFDFERLHAEREIDRLRNVELAHAYRELQGMHERLAEQAVELERLSQQDGLTGLHNRRSLDQRLATEVERVRRNGGELSLVMLDIDNFKEVNDRFSHTVGDEVLKRLALLLRDHTRNVDLAARFGGEEFVLLLPDTGPEGALTAAENLRRAFEAVPWTAVQPNLAITLSAGVATLSDTDDDAGSLLARADAHLYRAKQAGKNRVSSASGA